MRRFIIGTDWWTDCDDAVAMRILAKAHKNKEIFIEGVIINACMEYSVTSLDGFLQLEGCENIPIGIDLKATDFGGNPPYQKRLSSYAKNRKSNSDAKNGVRLYREILSTANCPVEMIEIGYLQCFVELLESGPDDISNKTGLELIEEKVSKLWVMAGKWDADGEKENNFCRNMRSRIAGKIFCEKCPVPVTFLGFEVGVDVITGDTLSHDDFLWQALNDHGSPNGRSSWDPMLVALALVGDENIAGYDCIKGIASVDEKTGQNYFKHSKAGKHSYVVKKHSNCFYQSAINKIIT